jgi:peptidoglycan hydrolase-like protein with peptidoglycan-binding domain
VKVEKFGSRGDSVRQLQESLRKAGYDPGQSDGVFGRNTRKAVRDFQSARGLKVDGKVGSKTRGAMDAFDRQPSRTQNPPQQQPTNGPMRPGGTQPQPGSGQQPGGAGQPTTGGGEQQPGSTGQQTTGTQTPPTTPAPTTPPPTTPPNATPTQATTTTPSTPPVAGTGAVTGNNPPGATPPPPKYFAFASPSDKSGHSNGLNVGEVKNIIDRYGKNVMVGFDRGSFSDSDLKAMQQGRANDISNPALKYAVQNGARLHAYVEGPGGATGEAWSSDEKARVRAAAASVGIHLNDPSNARDPGTIAWKDHGWKDYAHKQLTDLKKAGFDSVEIDNLDSASRVRNDPQGTVNFLKEYSQWWKNGEVPRLLPKNFEEGQWNAVNAAVKNGTLPRGMFTDYAIAERGVGSNRDEQARLAAQIRIQLIKSNDTNNYDAYGAYNIR